MFEEDFKKSIPSNIYYHRISDPANAFGNNNEKNNETTRFSRKNPFDIICFDGKYLYTLELKSVGGTSVTFYKEGYKNTSVNIQRHQIEELSKAAKFIHIKSGFIINYRKYDETYFIPIKEFEKYSKKAQTQTINIKNARKIGILIPQKRRRTRYSYILDDFFTK